MTLHLLRSTCALRKLFAAVLLCTAAAQAGTTLSVVIAGEPWIDPSISSVGTTLSVSIPPKSGTISFGWSTTDTGAMGVSWRVRPQASPLVVIASGKSTLAQPALSLQHYWFQIGSSFLAAKPPAKPQSWLVDVTTFDANGKPLGAASPPVTIIQEADDTPPTSFGPGAKFPNVTLMRYRENVSQVPQTQLEYGIAVVKVRLSNEGAEDTDPLWLSATDSHALMGSDTPVAVPAIHAHSELVLDLKMHAMLPPAQSQLPEDRQYTQWRRNYAALGGVDIRAVMDWRGPLAQAPISDHQVVDLYKGSGDSCLDRKQDGDEDGIDLGGSCRIMTSFDPAIHGFKFNNNFENDFIPAFDVRTSGLCGGMSYTALDYFNASMPIPWQPFRPANGTPLHSYLYDRQTTSILSNLDKWIEIGFNPLGARNTEFFHWGISAKKGERIDELRQFLDNGRPVVLGLQGAGSTGQHQVLAIGYEMGRYLGDLGDHVDEFRIYVDDPNYPGKTMTLIADVDNEIFHYREPGTTETWRTYFVDKKYNPQVPPSIGDPKYPQDGLVYELVLDFFTGGDDLRGGNDNVNLTVNLLNGPSQFYPNINLGARWIVNNDESAEIVLTTPIPKSQIASLLLTTTFQGGGGGDNWDINKLLVNAVGGGGMDEPIGTAGFKRFTGDSTSLYVRIN